MSVAEIKGNGNQKGVNEVRKERGLILLIIIRDIRKIGYVIFITS
jgi:hypothetical protein